MNLQSKRTNTAGLAPLTCADITSLPAEVSGWSLNGYNPSHVCLLGFARMVNGEHLRLDDRTGWVLCNLKSMSHEDKEALSFSFQGAYVRVCGRIVRKVQTNVLGGMEIGDLIFEIIYSKKVVNCNEISQHMLRCTHAKLLYWTAERRAIRIFENQGLNGSSQNISTSGLQSTIHLDQWDVQQRVLHVILDCKSECGLPRTKIHRKLPDSVEEIDEAIELLRCKGFICLTDEDSLMITPSLSVYLDKRGEHSTKF